MTMPEASRENLLRRIEDLKDALEATGEIANVCVYSNTGRQCPYCRCPRFAVE